MGAETRLAVVLVGSFVLWIPALSSVLSGELDAGVAGIRWGIGAAMVWAMVAALNQLIVGYAVATAEDGPRAPSTDETNAARRSSDRVNGSDRSDPESEVQDADEDDEVTGLVPDDSMTESA